MSLRSSWGVITNILDGMSDKEIKICLAHQFLSKAYRLVWRRDDKPFPLQTMFLTFEVLTLLPRSILVEYDRSFACSLQTLCGASSARDLDTPNNGVL